MPRHHQLRKICHLWPEGRPWWFLKHRFKFFETGWALWLLYTTGSDESDAVWLLKLDHKRNTVLFTKTLILRVMSHCIRKLLWGHHVTQATWTCSGGHSELGGSIPAITTKVSDTRAKPSFDPPASPPAKWISPLTIVNVMKNKESLDWALPKFVRDKIAVLSHWS